MTYELAKKLKTAGFPQKGNGQWMSDYWKEGEKYIIQALYVPTLSGLIEACGEQFYSIVFREKEWVSFGFPTGSAKVIEISGQTADEVVANLWIKLQSATT